MQNNDTAENNQAVKDFHIELGGQVFLQIHGIDSRMKSSLVGAAPGRYLIFNTPKTAGTDTHVYEGNLVTVTFLHSGVVYGFRSNILNHIVMPARLMFVSYPEAIEKYELRKHQRVECNIPASASIAGHPEEYKGIMVDISTGGCKFIFLAPASLDDHPIQSGDKLELTFELLGIRDLEAFVGDIRSVSHDDRKISVGVSFDQANTAALQKIDDYVRNVLEFL